MGTRTFKENALIRISRNIVKRKQEQQQWCKREVTVFLPIIQNNQNNWRTLVYILKHTLKNRGITWSSSSQRQVMTLRPQLKKRTNFSRDMPFLPFLLKETEVLPQASAKQNTCWEAYMCYSITKDKWFCLCSSETWFWKKSSILMSYEYFWKDVSYGIWFLLAI